MKKEKQEILDVKATVAQIETMVELRPFIEELDDRNHGIQKIMELEKFFVLDLKQKIKGKMGS